jgi:Ca2+-binding EF-hand superfamily protein
MPPPHELNIEDVRHAWKLICSSGHDAMTKSQAYERLLELFPNQINARDVKQLVGAGNLSIDKLEDMLVRQEPPKDLDAAKEAFKLLDVHQSGFAEISLIKHLLLHMPGIGTLDAEDMEFLAEVCDADRDGKIGFADFCGIGENVPPKEEQEKAIQILAANTFTTLLKEKSRPDLNA